MSTLKLTRRRALTILGVAAGLPLLPGALGAATPARLVRWQGTALGARASLALWHDDEAVARDLIADAITEIERLERVFSLYRPDSAVSTLNRAGRLDAPPLDLVRLLGEAQRYATLSGGAFDITVQPLWRLYADHFATSGAAPAGPPAAAIAAARTLVDFRAVAVEPRRITLGRPGMAVTLNGIAQGYITDRVADRLRARGMAHVLLDLGETRALGPQADGTPWSVGLADPQAPAQALQTVALTDGAVASSGGYGLVFDAAGRFTHILDPKSGHSPHHVAGVTVLAETATKADALSTTLAVLPRARGEEVLRGAGGKARAIFA